VQNRQAQIEVVPTTSTLLIKQLAEPERDRKKVKNIKHTGNLSMDQVLEVARKMRFKSMARTMRGTIKVSLVLSFTIPVLFSFLSQT
jgi:large subunit ribosomal protein L12e